MNLSVDLLQIVPPLLFFISFFGLITSRNVIKSIILLIVMQTSIIIFWLVIGSTHGQVAPILTSEQVLQGDLSGIADPLPQALMLTAIVIGISVTAIIITMLNGLFRKYGSTDWGTLAKFAHSKEVVLKEEL